MKNRPILFLILFLFLPLTACNPANNDSSTTIPPGLEILKLKEGMQLVVEHRLLDPNSKDFGKKQLRTISLDSSGGAEGISLTWKEKQAELASVNIQTMPEVNSGSLALPNLAKAPKMTLPALWAVGDLFLADSSGIWISDQAFAELKKDKETQFESGILDPSAQGMAYNLPLLESALHSFVQESQLDPKKLAELSQIKVSRSRQSFTMQINGREKSIPILNVENQLAHYKILDHVQNPLVLELTLFPKASIGALLFSPKIWIKSLLEYRVVGIYTAD